MAMFTGLKGRSIPRYGAHPERGYTVGWRETRPKPRWGLLYALGLCGVALIIVATRISAAAGWRGMFEGSAAGATLGAMGCWVRANRLVLAMESRAEITAETPEETTDMPVPPRALLTVSNHCINPRARGTVGLLAGEQ